MIFRRIKFKKKKENTESTIKLISITMRILQLVRITFYLVCTYSKRGKRIDSFILFMKKVARVTLQNVSNSGEQNERHTLAALILLATLLALFKLVSVNFHLS